MIYRFGDFQADSRNKVLRAKGEVVQLTPKSFDTLLVLLENAGTLVERETLMEQIWEDRFVEESNLTFNIRMLRKALGDDAAHPKYIETVPRRGYRFIAPVDSSEEAPDSHPAVAPAQSSRTGRYWFVAALLVAATAIGGFALFRNRGTEGGTFVRTRLSRVTTSGKAFYAVISPDGRYVVHGQNTGGKQSLLLRQVGESRDIEIVPPGDGEFIGFTVSPDNRSVYYTFLESNHSDSSLFQIPILGGAPKLVLHDLSSGVSFSPDGSKIAYYRTSASRGISQLFIADADGANEHLVAERQAPATFETNYGVPVWDPSGKRIIAIEASTRTGDTNRLIEIDLTTGETRNLADTKWSEIYQVFRLNSTGGLLLVVFDDDANAAQIYHFDPRTGESRRVSDGLNNYQGLSVSNDERVLISTRTEQITKLAVAGRDGTREILSETGMLSGKEGFSWTPDGRLVFRLENLGKNDLWITDLNEKKQITFDSKSNRHPTVCDDGGSVVYSALQDGSLRLKKISITGKDQHPLTTGDGEPEMFPDCSEKVDWVVFQRGWRRPTIWKVPVTGGEPVQLTATISLRPVISPDGRKFAYYTLDDSGWRVAVAGIDDGAVIKTYPIAATVQSRLLRWTPDGKSLAYAETRDGVSNIVVQPLDGGEPRRITSFDSEEIYYFDWSPDGDRVAYYRGTISNDVVEIANEFR